MDLYGQVRTHVTTSICYLLLIFEFSTIISNINAVPRASQHQSSEQIIVGRPFKKTESTRLQQQRFLSNKSEILTGDGHLEYLALGSLKVKEVETSTGSNSESDSGDSLVTQAAIGDHSLADDALLEINNSDNEAVEPIDEPKIEGK